MNEKWVAIQATKRIRHAENPIFSDGLWEVRFADDIRLLPVAILDRGDDHYPPTRSRVESRARLMAAAPDLLAACKALLADEYYQKRLAATRAGVGTDWGRVVMNAQSAIAKAEGRS